jgi:PAS domain S-box-containing protein
MREPDIEDNQRSVDALRASEERYRALVETTGTGYVILDSRGLVLDANKEYLRLTGRGASSDIIGKSVIEWTDESDKESNAAAITRCLACGFIRNFEVRYVSPEGKSTPVEINATVVGAGEQLKVVTLCRDISDRKQSEEMLRTAQKLESLGVLAGGIAHDFNNLLTGIFGFIDVARMDIAENSPARGNIDRAVSMFGRAKGLTQQLLTFSKGGAPEKKCVSIVTLLKETVQFDLSGSNIKPHLEIQEDLWPLSADIHQIGQVIDNIVINARQAMPLGGSIVVTAQNSDKTDAVPLPLSPGRYVCIAVRDFGMGIAPDILPKIFDPFFTTKPKGTGLGLAISYSIVKKHGGHIYAESKPGKGSKFTVYLPAEKINETDREEGAPASFKKGNHRVLLVDDQAFILEMGRRFLSEMGCLVTTASSGPEALHYYQKAIEAKKRFDLAILDLTIPGGVGGGWIMEKLLKIDPGATAIASSGYSDDPIMASPTKFGFRAKLPKPYLQEEFLKIVGSVLAQCKSAS